MTEWTPQERKDAARQIVNSLADMAGLRPATHELVAEAWAGGEVTLCISIQVAIDLACQRNLLLERFKELHNAGGQVWIEDLIHRIEPEWKSYWTLLAEEDARECALANEDGCPTGEHARTEEK
jgi:hypothetical protein